MRAGFLLAIVLACSSCSVIEQPSGLIPRWTTAWKEAATPDDRQRLAGWRSSFVGALASVRKAGHADDIVREGTLLEPDAAQGSPGIPNGLYRCRLIKLGEKDETGHPYVSYPASYCRLKPERDLQRFNKFGGSQRYVGVIFPGDALHQIFLGTLVLGDETRALQYGQDQLRDIAGYVERIGPNRWRLVMPKPHFESQLDVMELVPANGGAR
jgi:hypothetical protein